jgi:sulfur-carrier protein
LPVLRLFAAAREVAGTGSVDVAGVTVAEVLRAASSRFDGLAEVVARSGVWLNGEPTEVSAHVGPSDEVAVIPPVSGGCW